MSRIAVHRLREDGTLRIDRVVVSPAWPGFLVNPRRHQIYSLIQSPFVAQTPPEVVDVWEPEVDSETGEILTEGPTVTTFKPKPLARRAKKAVFVEDNSLYPISYEQPSKERKEAEVSRFRGIRAVRAKDKAAMADGAGGVQRWAFIILTAAVLLTVLLIVGGSALTWQQDQSAKRAEQAETGTLYKERPIGAGIHESGDISGNGHWVVDSGYIGGGPDRHPPA